MPTSAGAAFDHSGIGHDCGSAAAAGTAGTKARSSQTKAAATGGDVLREVGLNVIRLAIQGFEGCGIGAAASLGCDLWLSGATLPSAACGAPLGQVLLDDVLGHAQEAGHVGHAEGRRVHAFG
jgi:hypothetical protein